jgi:tripartite-type tricarboxylate transporter receptor subunit TctC
VSELFAANALEPVGSSSAEFRAHIKTQIARWTPVIRASGASVD